MVNLRMLSLLFLTTFLSLPLSSSTASLVFTAASPGSAKLGDIALDGDLTISLEFRTGASEGQLLYMRELTAGHHISLFVSDGGLYLQVHPDSSIGPVTEATGEIFKVDDNKWHKVFLTINDGPVKFIMLIIDDLTPKTSVVQSLPLLDNTKYETFIGGISPNLSVESEAPYVGCMRNIRVLETDRDLQDLQMTGVIVEECSLDFTFPAFHGSLLGVITETHKVGSVIMKIQAVTGDSNSQISYELVENPHNYFALGQINGSLTIARQLDRVALAAPSNVLIFTVKASARIGK